MPRVKRRVTARARHKKAIGAAKSFRGRRSNIYHIAKQAVVCAGQYAYRDRRNRKRVFRTLWIARINTSVCEHGLTYSRLMNDLKEISIEPDRKVLSNIVTHDKIALAATANQVKTNAA